MTKKYHNLNWLREQIKSGRSRRNIARECNVGIGSICYFLKKYVPEIKARYIRRFNMTKKEAARISSREYFNRNKEKYKEYREKNREHLNKKAKERIKLLYKKEPWKKHFIYAQHRCHYKKHSYYKRKLIFLLSINDAKKLWLKYKAYNLKYPSIDRINNKKGYFYSNCRFIELKQNMKRSKLNLRKGKNARR